jgi:NDP-sugar pyrophosphorylase family protein
MKQAVILAGGAGTRLRPLTLDIPKPMIEINGKPFLLYIIEELKKYGIKEFVFCIGYLADKFKEFFGDGSRFGVRISYSIEKEFAGTGGALSLAKDLLDQEFFVINGDTYLPINYLAVYEKFKGSNKTGLLVLYDNQEKITAPNIALDDDGNIAAYIKKETLKIGEKELLKANNSNLSCRYIDAGVQIFNKNILNLIPDKQFVSLEVDIFPKLIAQRELATYITSQRYYDLGTPERLDLVRKVLK